MKITILFCALVLGCGGVPARKPPPDLTGVVAAFTPTQVPLSQAIGISTGGIPFGSDPTSQAARASYFDRIRAFGGSTLRRDFLWSRIEPSQGVFDFTADDVAVADATAHGVATLGILAYNAPWATPTGDDHAPPDPEKYATFVQAVTAHFRGKVAAWEIWNEPNIGFRFWKPFEDPAAYAAVLARAYPAAKAGDPQTPVLFGGISWHGADQDGLSFIEDAYFARPDLGRFYDVMAIHPYAEYPPANPPDVKIGRDPPLEVRMAQVRAMLAYYGDGKKPIWVTEEGWPSYGPVDEATQARFTVRAVVELLASGADRVLLYTLDDGGDTTFAAAEASFGLERMGPTPKPAYSAVATLLHLDPSAIPAADESSAQVRALRFAGASGFRVLFSPDGQMHPFSSTGARVIDEQGQSLAMTPAALMVGPDPIYVLP